MSNKISLPKLISIELKNFSLYEREGNDIVVNLNNPITCIIGANGLGKSTLINCINYGLTGVINRPGKNFKSVNDFYETNKYSFEYFSGRISDMDRDYATVTVQLSIKNVNIIVSRKFFPNESVINFECSSKEFSSYEEAVVKLMGLNSFEQFVFLQIKVLTFDEERECLFWDSSILTPTLHLAMGINAETAAKADELASESQKSNSRVRNLQYEINKMNKRIQTLQEALDSVNNSESVEKSYSNRELIDKYNSMNNNFEESKVSYEKLKIELDITNIKITELSTESHLKKSEYDKIYNKLFTNKSINDISNNPLIIELYKGHCNLCGNSGKNIWKYVDGLLKQNKCPICCSELTKENSDNQENIIRQLKEIDESLTEINIDINENVKKATRLRDEMSTLESYIDSLEKEIYDFNKINEIDLEKYKHDNSSEKLIQQIRTLSDAITTIEQDKQKEIVNRDSYRDRAVKLQNSLNKSYEEAQEIFLPKFRTLARAFTGLDVDIRFTQISNDARELIAFVLSLKDVGRKSEQQLSESQRFFIDIALRMSIIDYIEDKTNEGCILVDAPEGSLDIAYETNAGEMFREYVNRGHQLIVTANLNSSGLTKTLAKGMNKNEFNLVNMLSWANLSAIQIEKMKLFKGALNEITAAMEMRD